MRAFALFIAFYSTSIFADQLVLKTNERVDGRYIRGTNSAIFFEINDELKRFDIGTIKSMSFKRSNQSDSSLLAFENLLLKGVLKEQTNPDAEQYRFSLELTKPFKSEGKEIIKKGARLIGDVRDGDLKLKYFLSGDKPNKIESHKPVTIVSINDPLLKEPKPKKKAEKIKNKESNSVNYSAQGFLKEKELAFYEKHRVTKSKVSNGSFKLAKGAEIHIKLEALVLRKVNK